MQHLRKPLTTTLSIDTYPRDLACVVLIEAAHYGQIQPPADGGERHMVNGKNLKINYDSHR